MEHHATWHTSDRTGSPGLAEVPMLNSSETQKGFSKISSREDGECVGCVVLQRIKCGVRGVGSVGTRGNLTTPEKKKRHDRVQRQA